MSNYDVTRQVVRIPGNLIDPGPNDRKEFDPVALRELADSIQKDGLAQPPLVRPMPNGRYEIVAGERRCRAMALLTWELYEVFVEAMDDERASALMLAENVQRADLNPIEEAMGYRSRMERFGWTIPQVAEKANVPESRVRARLPLLDLIPDLVKMVKDGHMGVGLALKISRLNPDNQMAFLRWLLSQPTKPTTKRAEVVIEEMYAAQQQASLFDLGDFNLQGAVLNLVETADGEMRTILPAHPVVGDIPITDRTRGVAQALDAYIADLLDANHRSEAAVLMDFWRKMMDSNFIKMVPADSVLVKRHPQRLGQSA